MFKNKKFIIGVLIVSTLVVLIIISCVFSILEKKPSINYAMDSETLKETALAEIQLELKRTKKDIAIGRQDAPVQIISYDSYSCLYCALFFSKVFPLIEAKYIKTGKVLFIHRDFPIDLQGLVATKIVQCFASKGEKQKERAFGLIRGIFEAQKDWVSSEDYTEKLLQIAGFAGLSSNDARNCLKDEELENRILEERLNSSRILKLTGTPTFFINNNKLNRDYSFAVFEEEIEAILANK